MARGVPRIPEPWEWVRTKQCTVCGETKPLARFSPHARWPDGRVRWHSSRCHECDNRRPRRAWRDPAAERSYRLQWAKARRAAIRHERKTTAHLLPSRPVKDLLSRLIADSHGEETLGTLSARCNVVDGVLRRVMRQDNVTLRLADEICVGLGYRVYDLYPELEEEAA